jgi:hypothetical protein
MGFAIKNRSSLFDGDAYGANQLPIVLAGGAGGTLKADGSSISSQKATTTAADAASISRLWIRWERGRIASATPMGGCRT